MKRLIRVEQDDEVDIDITPMLDIVFIMLIFFIVTANFIQETGLEFNKPDSNKSANPSAIKPIVVEIRAQDEILIDGRLLDPRSIRPTVVRMITEEPKAPIIIQAHKHSTTRAVVQAVDGIRAATGYRAKPPTVVVTE